MKFSSLSYHVSTSYRRGAISPHFLDWENQPTVFKKSPKIEPVFLKRTLKNGKSFIQELVEIQHSQRPISEIDLDTLSSILLLTCTITAKAVHSGSPFYFRSAASAGALYPSEIYVRVNGLQGLDDGLYHYGLDTHGLHLLAKHLQSSIPTMITFFLSSIFFRSAWKYRDRAYRYCLLDTGHVLENLLLSLRAHKLAPNFSYDFDDNLINDSLALDPKKEACLAYCPLGEQLPQSHMPRITDMDKENLRRASRVSQKEIIYEAIDGIHRAGGEVKGKRSGEVRMDQFLGLESRLEIPIPTLSSWQEQHPYKEALFSRRSRRNFIPEPLSQSSFHVLLRAMISETKLGYLDYPLSIGLVLENVEGYRPGLYLLNRKDAILHLVKEGSFVQNMAHICLDQAWLARAAMQVVFLTNLKTVDDVWGPRGYRYVMMESGRLGQLIYLLTTSLGVGCCGIGAFYDDEAARLLGLNNTSRLLYLVALGPIKGAKGKKLEGR